MALTRRSFVRGAVLAPLAPVVAAATAKLGGVASGVLKATPQSALDSLVRHYEQLSRYGDRWSVALARFHPGDLVEVRYVHRYEVMAPSTVDRAGRAVNSVASTATRTGTVVFNAGKEAVHFLGQIIPPGAWTEIHVR